MARLLAAATLAATAGAFLAPAPVSTPVVVRAENSEAFPFLKRPEKLDGSMVGDVGFDPLRLAEVQVDLTYARGAEVKHGRIAMLACVGFIIQESFHPLFSGVGGPAIDQIPQLPYWWWAAALGGITLAEFARIRIAFRELNGETLKAETALRPGYKPGQIGFDPLGLAPDDPAEFRIMQEKELAHARLGMIAAAGFLSQEAVTKTTWAVADGL